jgi:hypothetical protein
VLSSQGKCNITVTFEVFLGIPFMHFCFVRDTKSIACLTLCSFVFFNLIYVFFYSLN